jgi:hypothetical protein
MFFIRDNSLPPVFTPCYYKTGYKLTENPPIINPEVVGTIHNRDEHSPIDGKLIGVCHELAVYIEASHFIG